ncbi:hypothetical protein [Phenylobacterium sp.]|uniref:hypothetical protein n=1 Tax=Phenylobacterium sp. TaxID=1871053 RepID=UPI0012292FB3|nr:hypothetical protein [Phenylobacterium sp.]THD57678.1 MAG: hypothetical protein E8A12_13165 [Phenylobacterium sp.]
MTSSQKCSFRIDLNACSWRRGEPDVLLAAIKESSELDEGGKMLSARLLDGNRKTDELRPYPFIDRMVEVLPWWERFGQSAGAAEDDGA